MTNAHANRQKILEDRIQLRRVNGGYEAIISSRFTVYRAWGDDPDAAQQKAIALAKKTSQ